MITVGVPVYNAMPFLPECLDSIFAQEFADFRLLVINDGSTDSSTKYLRSLNDSRLRLIEQENQGIAAVRNRMLMECSTPWLMLLDADDVAYPQRLTRTVQYIRRYPDAAVLYSMADFYPGRQRRLRTTRKGSREIRKLVCSGYLPDICNSTAALNVKLVRSVGGYRGGLYAVEDTDLWWRIALQHEIQFIPEALTGYRHNPHSLSTRKVEEQETALLYVQYLLLSHLWHRKPRTLQELSPALRNLNPQSMKFRRHKRELILALGEGEGMQAASHALRALSSYPRAFLERLLDECFPRRSISLGQPPALFLKQHGQLWHD